MQAAVFVFVAPGVPFCRSLDALCVGSRGVRTDARAMLLFPSLLFPGPVHQLLPSMQSATQRFCPSLCELLHGMLTCSESELGTFPQSAEADALADTHVSMHF